MYYLAIRIGQTNFGADYDTVIGVYDNLAAAEGRIARAKKRPGAFGSSFRIDTGEMNTDRGNW
jgi:hypothetical protein